MMLTVLTGWFGILACLLLASAMPGVAGQMAGHTYVALQAKRFLSGPARAAVDANLNAYLSGAQGPDVLGVVMTKLDTASAFTSVGKETHYSDRKAELAVNLLDCATTDEERAYALGWMTHYANDIFVHSVVNDYGGYYEKDDKHHKVLEQLETKHVFSKLGNQVNPTLSVSIPSAAGPTFGGFIFDAYHKTFPANPIYQSGNEWLVTNRPYFCKRYLEAASWCRAASERFYQSHTSGTGEHGWALAGLPFPAMPSTAAYNGMQQAIEIKDMQTQAQYIRVRVRVNDNKLYGRFLVDWDTEIETAVQYMNQVFSFASVYLAEKDPVKKAAFRRELLDVVPNVNLDQPHATFDFATAKPGNVSINRISYQVTLYKKAEDGKPLPKAETLKGISMPVTLKETGFAEAQAGEVTFDIPLPANAAPYRFTLQLALSGLEALKVPAYKNVDWTQAEGAYPGTWMSGAGGVMVTDTFTVRMPIPDSMAGKPGARRWVLMPEGQDIKEEDLPLIKSRLADDRYRYDVEALEEKIDGKELTALLQVTDTNPYTQKIAGRCRLVMIWFTDGKADTDIAGSLDDLNKELEEATKLMEEASEIMDNLLTDEQEEKLGAIMQQYEAELTAKGVKEEDIQPLMTQRAFDEMKKMGVDLTKLTEINQKVEALSAKSTVPFHVGTTIDLAPADLRFDTAADWKAGDIGNQKMNNMRGATRQVEQKDGNKLHWTLEAGVNVILLNDQESVKTISARLAGKGEPVSVSGFTGTVSITDKVGRQYAAHVREITGEGLLRKGNVYLHISFSATAKGFKIQEPDEDGKLVLVYDGAGDADAQAERALSDITGMYRGIRLLPVR